MNLRISPSYVTFDDSPMSLYRLVAVFLLWASLLSAADDPELDFSTDLREIFPEIASIEGSNERFENFFISYHPDFKDEYFAPWLSLFNQLWHEALRKARRDREEFDLAEIELGNLWEKAAPLWENITDLAERDEFRLYAELDDTALDQLLSFQHLRSVVRLALVRCHEDSLSEEERAKILRPLVWILGEINRQSIDSTGLMISVIQLRDLWDEFPEIILQDPKMREVFSEVANNWAKALSRGMVTDVLFLEKTLRQVEEEGGDLFELFNLASVVEADPHTLDKIGNAMSRTYVHFILTYRFLPNHTLNRFWKIQQERIALLAQGEFDRINDPAEEVYGEVFESPLFHPNKGGQFILGISLPTYGRIAEIAASLAEEVSAALAAMEEEVEE
ncbi:MAG: hypothetical protein LAT55_01870 [Opitutales bacterium]|nr:hypothetical protein [Opitutales bacterium]